MSGGSSFGASQQRRQVRSVVREKGAERKTLWIEHFSRFNISHEILRVARRLRSLERTYGSRVGALCKKQNVMKHIQNIFRKCSRNLYFSKKRTVAKFMASNDVKAAIEPCLKRIDADMHDYAPLKAKVRTLLELLQKRSGMENANLLTNCINPFRL